MASADVVIIGGGVNGVSAAFSLASLGVRRVTVVERRHLAAGATGKSGSLVRMHYTNETESRLAWESHKVFRDFANVVGGDCGFDATGFVQIVGPAHADALAANVAMQQRIGIDTRLVSRSELSAISPDLRVDDIGAAAYEPGAGSPRLSSSRCRGPGPGASSIRSGSTSASRPIASRSRSSAGPTASRAATQW